MADRKTILAVNHDVGSVRAMIPALQVLKDEFMVIPVTWPDSPAYAAFMQAGFEPPIFSGFWDDRPGVILDFYLSQLKPALVLLGVSTIDSGPETIVLRLKEHCPEIPIAFIYETWPHGWLNWEDKRELYKGTDRVLAFDHFSAEEFIRNGFDAHKVVMTGNPANDDLVAMMEKEAAIRYETRVEFGAGPDDTVLLYCTTNQDAPECHGSDSSHPRWLGFTEREVIELIFYFCMVAQLDRKQVLPTHLWVRIHPAQARTEIEELLKKSGVRATIIGSELPDGRPLLLAADVVFGTVTTMLQMAAFLGRPAFSCLPRLTTGDLIFSNKLRITIPLYHEAAIAGLVLASSYVPEFSRKHKVSGGNYQLIPHATENVCRALREMIA